MGLFDMMRVCKHCRQAVKTGITGKCPSCKNSTILPDNPSDQSYNRTMAQWKTMSEAEKQEFVDFCLGNSDGKKIDKEYRVKCETCGHIYCYTQSDLEANLKHAKKALGASVMSFGNAVSGTQYGFHANEERSQRELDKMVDYTKCPKCNSRSIRQLTEEEYKKAAAAAQAGHAPALSSAEELKKFKELLDMGVISQEEFDAKKKQLLGL